MIFLDAQNTSDLDKYKGKLKGALVLNTYGTDDIPFNRIGLPAFQFIQDWLDYGRTHHSSQDVYDRVIPEDAKQTSVILAAFAYSAAMLDERLPRKALEKDLGD